MMWTNVEVYFLNGFNLNALFWKDKDVISIYCHKFSFQSFAVVQAIYPSEGHIEVNIKLCFLIYMKIKQLTPVTMFKKYSLLWVQLDEKFSLLSSFLTKLKIYHHSLLWIHLLLSGWMSFLNTVGREAAWKWQKRCGTLWGIRCCRFKKGKPLELVWGCSR